MFAARDCNVEGTLPVPSKTFLQKPPGRRHKECACYFFWRMALLLVWLASSANAAQTPHPAVVRVIAAEADGSSLGSGALVAVDANHGLVVTNWHVVRDATGPITVVFPDGFRSGALVLKTDRDWDLAALAIQRPNVQPLPLAVNAPRPGEPLSITGYGSGSYRTVAGKCAEYHSPGKNLPAEIVEVDVPARFGDSGGPICNSRGEIAGILFGANGNMVLGGYTMGSYCGRVRQFLAVSYVDFQRLPGNTAMLAQAPAPTPPPPPTKATIALPPPNGAVAALNPISSPPNFRQSPAVAMPLIAANPIRATQTVESHKVSQNSPVAVATADSSPSRIEQIKTILAIIGVVSMLFHAVRLIGASAG